MTFDDIKGNDKLIARLKNIALCGNISHAYIFEGDTCIDKVLVAECFIKAVLCPEEKGVGCDRCSTCNKISHGNHEDILYVEADGRSIKDEVIIDLQEKLRKRPLIGERNIAIIKDADTMTPRAQNRLLKTLEEPAGNAIIILLSENIENLIATILSRCVVYRLQYFGTDAYAEIIESAGQLADMMLKGEPFYQVKVKLSEFTESRESGYRLLDALERIYGDLATKDSDKSKLYRKEEIYRAVASIEQARRNLQRGIGVGYALKNMIIEIGG